MAGRARGLDAISNHSSVKGTKLRGQTGSEEDTSGRQQGSHKTG